jgi:hypothetical protein
VIKLVLEHRALPLTARASKCAGCGRRVTRSEPDILLRRLSEDNPLIVTLTLRYHERCKEAVLDRVTETPPAAWRITHRTVNAEAN